MIPSPTPHRFHAFFSRHCVTAKCVAVLLVVMFNLTPSHAWSDKPNVVFILADDMGYGDVQAINPDSRIPTPHLNALAAQGMFFSDAHTPSSVCTPTRYGLLTGRYCWRTRLQHGVLDGYGKPLIEKGRPTLASFLKSQGYRCGIVGKWHLGLDFSTTDDGQSLDFTGPVGQPPNEYGFDFSYIIPASLDFPPYVFICDGTVTDARTVIQEAQKFPAFLRKGPRSQALIMENCLDHLVGQAEAFLSRAAQAERKQPFFLYFPLTAPHKPVLPHPSMVGKTELGPYGDFVHQVDQYVGRLLAHLDTLGVAEETLVVFTSDNGSFMFRRNGDDAPDHVDDKSIQAFRADRHRANGPFRGTKADIWEAGHRVPFFVRWPGHVEQGSRCETTVCLTDVMATLADIVGADCPVEAQDSFSFWPLLQGTSDHYEREPVIHHSVNGSFAIRQGPWKLVATNGSGGREPPTGKPFERPYALFNLHDDLSESQNVVANEPEIASRLEAELDRIRKMGL
ncbi:MAG: arylsulfatase [Planctomycetales bacterium]|nr:arylsulfatase [Planctomycetales bacterium]